MNSILEKIDKVALFFIGYTILFFLFFNTLSYTLPFVLALICCLIILKPTNYLIRRFKMKGSLAAIITTFLFFTLLIALLTLAITALTGEAIQLGKNTQTYIQQNSDNITKNINIIQNSYKNLDPTIVSAIEKNLESITTKLSNTAIVVTSNIITLLLNIVSYIPYIIMVILFTFLATYFFTKDFTSAKNKMLNIIPCEKSTKLFYIFRETRRMLTKYILSYMLIIFITFVETVVFFSILKVKYAFLLSVIAGIFDILPVIGIAAVYIPLSLLNFASHHFITGCVVLGMYALVMIVRHLLEPKIVSSTLGLHPVSVLAAIFIGLKANGLSGMIFCVFLVVFYNIMKKVNVL